MNIHSEELSTERTVPCALCQAAPQALSAARKPSAFSDKPTLLPHHAVGVPTQKAPAPMLGLSTPRRDTHQLPIFEPHNLGGWGTVGITL